MINKKIFIQLTLGIGLSVPGQLEAQENSLTNTTDSPHSKLRSVDMQDVKWTEGFWADWFTVSKEKTLPFMWQLYHDDEVNHAAMNFRIAAGEEEGRHRGPSFHDGDFYKIFEAMASIYAVTRDPELDKEMDKAIAMIQKAQREDGYLHTPVLIEQRWGTLGEEQMQKQLGFEKYNMGHLMTAACVHYRATGKDNFLKVAKGVADFLYDFYQKASPELARNAICPSHYMGITEMYRTLKDPRYLKLAQNLIDIRGKTDDGTDDNQDRMPFREQKVAMGHAVRANYLYAGVADLYAETGEELLLENLESIWDDVVYSKMYVNGGCGALYDGVSPDGTSYKPSEVQKTHQSYGKPFQLPNADAHNETCANIGNLLWNWRMLQVSEDAKHADVMELNLYNSILSGINLEGTEFFYTNPLSARHDLPYELRWPNKREGYISKSNCCPPNVARTLAQVNNYAYSTSEKGLFVNLYGSNSLSTTLWNGSEIELRQVTDYPWDETIRLSFDKVPTEQFSLFLRVPEWCRKAHLTINGQKSDLEMTSGTYVEVNRKWEKDDEVKLVLAMPIEYLEANPLVEEAKNQITVKRGPLVYCVESMDLPSGRRIDDVVITNDIQLRPEWVEIAGHRVMGIEGDAYYKEKTNWEKKLYQPVQGEKLEQGPIKLIPYFAWANRGQGEMSVWLPYR